MRFGIKIFAVVAIMSMIGPAMAQQPTGAVMATDSTGNPDANLFPGTVIYIVGHHLLADAPFRWEIYDMDAGCGGNPLPGPIGCGTLKSSGSGGTVNPDRTISPPFPTGWNLPEPDYNGHQYKLVVYIGTGPDQLPFATFYTEVDSFAPVPEAATIVLTSAGIFGILLISRKYR